MSGADRSGDAAGNDGAAVGVRDAAAAGDGAVAPGGTLLEPTYDHRAVEARRRRDWRERDAFATPAPDPSRRDAYVKSVCPFTSGHIHVGHVRSYTIGDAYARWRRLSGDAVLFSIGFDAFGLPAELAAIANGEPPADWVQRSYEHMLDQFERMGFSFDWERVFVSSDEEQYRWSQWLFLAFLEAGMLYQDDTNVDFCDGCQTTLASLQVEDGRCWRCGGPVRLVRRKQWFLRISAYLEENERGIDAHADRWDKPALTAQRAILGRVDGAELDLAVVASDAAPAHGAAASHEAAEAHGAAAAHGAGEPHAAAPNPGSGAASDAASEFRLNSGRNSDPALAGGAGGAAAPSGEAVGGALTIFTEHPDAVGQARFVAISPRHPRLEELLGGRSGALAELEEIRQGGWQRGDRSAESVPAIDTGVRLRAPNGAELPLVISPAVDGRYGPTAVLGIPAADESDGVIARRLEIPAPDVPPPDPGAPPPAAPRPAVRYRAGDFAISRQRSWGAPIPIVHCPDCGEVPVPMGDLPVRLPRDLRPTGEGNPLADHPDFATVACPRCGADARRETDTLDCHFDDLWMWLPTCVPKADRARSMFDHPECERWLPGAMLIHGADGGGYFFDQRITAKALRDIGPLAHLADGEQFTGAVMHEMVTQDGRKMSKHLGNVVDPDELMERVGADTTRLAVLHGARPSRALNWTENAVQYCAKFLGDLWELAAVRLPGPDPADAAPAEREPDGSAQRRERLALRTATAAAKVTEDLERVELQRAVKNVVQLFERIVEFEGKATRANRGELAPADALAVADALSVLATLLTPFAPHVGEELWLATRHGAAGVEQAWPAVADAPAEPAAAA
ncbi:MAG: class I tRNA ligase family protein [Solirubrobacterales bacterium]|nr:class I tRNA ligase family protein [Solirubrobacterales bacterium]